MEKQKPFKKLAMRFLRALLVLLLCCVPSRVFYGATALDSKNLEEVNMLKGDLEAIKVYSLGRVSITNPEVADIANVDSDQILLLAKKPGQTVLFLWDEYGKRTVV